MEGVVFRIAHALNGLQSLIQAQYERTRNQIDKKKLSRRVAILDQLQPLSISVDPFIHTSLFLKDTLLDEIISFLPLSFLYYGKEMELKSEQTVLENPRQSSRVDRLPG